AATAAWAQPTAAPASTPERRTRRRAATRPPTATRSARTRSAAAANVSTPSSAPPRCEETMSSSNPQPGDVLAGKYRIEQVLGVGGMGAVVSAHHEELDQKV